MPSPFPGMNPYLEQEDAWHDFHERFMPLVAECIAAQVDPRYIVKIDEHLYIHELPGEQRRFLGRADISVAHGPLSGLRETMAVLEAPMELNLPAVDRERVAYVEIRDRRSRQLATMVELLGPANKRPGPDRQQYLAKRNEILASPTHFVEIDLLRGGQRMPVEDLPRCDYCVLVSRWEARPRAGIWLLGLRQALPLIPIPLRAPDADAQLDLQNVLHEIYDKARYRTYVYDGSPEPPLSPEEEAWARSFVPAE